MDVLESLTTEKLGKKFKSQFELVNFSIVLVHDIIASQRAPRVDVDSENPAVQVLAEISNDAYIVPDITKDKASKA